MAGTEAVLYGDAAVREMASARVHLMSSLTWEETQAVIDRMRRMGAVACAVVTAAHESWLASHGGACPQRRTE